MTPTRRTFAVALAGLPAALAVRPRPSLAQMLPSAEPENLFISPCGQPFRAELSAPYPVVDWFKAADANGDGKLSRTEFVADAERFFKVLDLNHDGFLSPYEIEVYETRICPEVLGGHYDPTGDGGGALVWKVQMGGMGGMGGGPTPHPSGDSEPTFPDAKKDFSEAGNGASPYSFFNEPEPVAAADVRFRGIIARQDFLDLSDRRFNALDRAGAGFLTLASLPETPMQRQLARRKQRRR